MRHRAYICRRLRLGFDISGVGVRPRVGIRAGVKELDTRGLDLRDPALLAVLVLVGAGPQHALDVDRAALLQAAGDSLGQRSPGDHLVSLGVELRLAVGVTALVFIGSEAEGGDVGAVGSCAHGRVSAPVTSQCGADLSGRRLFSMTPGQHGLDPLRRARSVPTAWI